MRKNFYWPVLAVVFAFASLTAVSAQVLTSQVTGKVVDQTGGVLPGVTVTLTNLQTTISETAVTSDDGVYTFPQVLPGSYRVSAENPGFKKSCSGPRAG